MRVTNSPVALITGASSGIGQAVSEQLLKLGYIVYGLSRSGRAPAGVTALTADIGKAETVQQAVSDLIQQSGRLDVVINAAGIGGAGPVEAIPVAEARKVIETNFFGALNVAQATLPHLRRRERAHLIMVSSIAGLMGIPYRGIYSASKAAVEMLVESIRLEVRASGVRVFSVLPGDTATPIIGHQYRMPYEQVDSFYRESYREADQAMVDHVQEGMSPDFVAGEIIKLLQNDRPAVRYPIGALVQKASTLAKRLLPSRVYERILAGYYKL